VADHISTGAPIGRSVFGSGQVCGEITDFLNEALLNWHNVRRSDLLSLRAALRKGALDAVELDGILGILREVRQRPATRPYLARSLDAFFSDLGLAPDALPKGK
jgi:hypothetical protein